MILALLTLAVCMQDTAVAPVSEPSSPEVGLTAEDVTSVRAWIDETIEAWNVPGVAVAVVSKDGVHLVDGFGIRSVGGSTPVDERTLFSIGSSTKAFTCLALAQAADGGDLAWSDEVREHLPAFRLQDERATVEITVRDVVTHRLGLPRHDLMWYGQPSRTREELVAGMRHLEPNAGLRERFQYNNLGYVVAAEILRGATGYDWNTWVEQRIFAPLGMDDSRTRGADFLGVENRADGHRLDDDAAVTMPHRTIDAIGPAGSITSSAKDMARWARLHLSDGELDGTAVIEAASLKQLHTPQMALGMLPSDEMLGTMAYAHGWFVDSYRGHLRLQHGGNIDGFSAMVALFPMDDLGVVCLANMNASAVPEYVVRRVADLAFDLEPRGWSEGDLDEREEARAKKDEKGDEPEVTTPRVEGTSPAHPIANYAGKYVHPGYGEVVVVADGDTLSASIGELAMPLEHWHFETFRVTDESELGGTPLASTLVQFHTNTEGLIEALSAKIEPSVAAVRFEVSADASLSDPELLAQFAGAYMIGELKLTVAMRGDELTVTVPGQPTYTLEPSREDAFELKGLDGYSIVFQRDDAGTVNAAELRQPNGTAVAERAEPDGDD